jgi:hypothetical protein
MITITIHTASLDNFLISQGIPSYFEAVVENLSHQTFKDFELVFVDTYYDENKEKFNQVKSTFTIKHVPIHYNHRYWYDQGYVYISAAKNTGIIYADGELIISFDDGEFFPETLLNNYWDHYKNGHLMHAYHHRMKSIETINGLVKNPINGDIYINDSRKFNSDSCFHRNGTWTYAGTSFSLEDALILNGFNERLDGYKSLEDCDFGLRLVMLNKKFVIDKKFGFIYILDHPSYIDQNKKLIKEFIAVENHGLLMCAKELFEIEANKYPITDKHLEIIRRETIKYRNFDPLSEGNKDKLNHWLKTPTFNLRKEREEIRNSKDWKW